jgi:hypothetical protein
VTNRERVIHELRAAHEAGKSTTTIGGHVWVRQPSGWAKQYAWAGDPLASVRLSEIGAAAS